MFENNINVEQKPIGGLKPTGIAELDAMLRGGIPSDSTILLAGDSGTGKTILTLQWLAAGYEKYHESGLYLTLTEPVNKIKRNAERLRFWNPEYVTPGQIYVEDLRTVMNSLGLSSKQLTVEDIDNLLDEIGTLIEKCNARRVVIDSITAIAQRLHDTELIRTFIYHLDALLTQLDINVVLTSEVLGGKGYSAYGVEEFISDGIIKLSREKHREEVIRRLQIVKMRGVEYDSHPASYRISKDGIKLYPRLMRELVYQVSPNRLSTGIDGLDKMTHGGYFEGSTILISGSSGTGKSLISLQFLLKGLQEGRKVMLVSFEESRDQILRNANGFGWNLEEYEKNGQLKILVSYPEQRYLEEHIEVIRAELDAFGAKQIVIDSLSSLGNVFSEDVLRDFVSRFNAYLKEKLVTTIFTHATATLLGANQITDAHLSTITDQIIMLRYVEIESELKHAVLILKMRGSKHDKKLREVVFTKEGISVDKEFSGFEGVLQGSTKKVSSSIEEQLRDIFLDSLGPMGEVIFRKEKEKGLNPDKIIMVIEKLEKQGVLNKKKKEEFMIRVKQILEVKNN